METGLEYLKNNIEKTNIPEEYWEYEIGEMMELYADYYHKEQLRLISKENENQNKKS